MDSKTIRSGLYNIKTRAGMMDALIEQGTPGAAAVLPLLQDRDEGVRWAAIRVLAEIGNEASVAPLLDLLDQSKNVSEVIRALQAITGQELGDKATAWRQWVLQKQGGGGLPKGVLSDKELMVAAVKGLPVTLSGEGQEYEVKVSLPDRRTQSIRVDFSERDADGQPVVQLTTPCAPAIAEKYETVLKLNMTVTYGAFGVAILDDTLYFALIHTLLRATAHPEDIAKSIMCLARHGDALERMLSARDAC